MYSNAGPVIFEPSVFFAIGSVIVVLKPAVLVPAALSHPLQTIVYPRGIRNDFARMAASVTEPGSLPPAGKRPREAQGLPPRLGVGSTQDRGGDEGERDPRTTGRFHGAAP